MLSSQHTTSVHGRGIVTGDAGFLWSLLVRAFTLSNPTDRITALEGMRGYAVLLVFLVHHHTLFSSYLPPHSLAYIVSDLGHAIGNSGVDLFFVISGFLIYGYILKKQTGYFAFLKRRIRRIYPAFLCVFLIYVALCHLIPTISKLPQQSSDEILYLIQGALLMPGIFAIDPLVTVTWSLSYEVFFYLSIPLIVQVTRMRQWPRFPRVLLFFGFLLVHYTGYAMGYLPHIRISLFIAGILLYELYDSGWANTRTFFRGEWLVIAAYLAVLGALGGLRASANHIATNRDVPAIWTTLLCMALPVLVLYCISFHGLLNAVFSTRPLRWLGNMSYSYFLIHGLALNAVAFLLKALIPDTHSVALFLVILVANLVVTLLASLLLFVFVEWPISLSVKKHAAVAVAISRLSERTIRPDGVEVQ